MDIKGQIIQKAVEQKISDRKSFFSLIKKELKDRQDKFPSNYELKKRYEELRSEGKIERAELLEQLLVSKKVRSSSGVSVITVLTKPWPCPGECLYCPQEKGIPKSYLSGEPAVQRAKLCNFEAINQVKARLRALSFEGHPTDKIEIIIIGGTFSALEKKYQEHFVKDCFDALNGEVSKNLEEAKGKNETAKTRCVGLTLETRPDYIDKKEVEWMRYLGATRVELGVQSIDDAVLLKNKRGHNSGAVMEATALLKDGGFKICYHFMPNLLGSDPEKDVDGMKELFQNEAYRPDYLKIYPTMVIKGSELYEIWEKGGYTSYTDEQLEDVVIRMKKEVPYWVRLKRVIRDVPAQDIESGTKRSNLREVIQKKIEAKGERCKCIRCREVGLKGREQEEKVVLFREDYPASGGKEIFLSYENSDRTRLYSLLRLRFPGRVVLEEIRDCALIREIHTYGQETEIGKSGEVQHSGLGKLLLAEAESIARGSGYQKMAVISGVGVRGYYRNLGYELSKEYMVKALE